MDLAECASGSVCVGANIHVNVCVREWVWLIVRENTCDVVLHDTRTQLLLHVTSSSHQFNDS